MIKRVIVTNYVGDSLDIDLASPFDTGLAILDIDGVAKLNATINTSDVATNDGSLYNSARVESRDITFTIKPLPLRNQTVEDGRLLIYKYFPIKKKVTLRFITENRDVVIDGYVEDSDSGTFDSFVKHQVSILCPFPYFEDYYTQRIDFSGVNPLFEFPFGGNISKPPVGEWPEPTGIPDWYADTDAMIFSELLSDQVRLITYDGDVDNGMQMTIHAIGDVEDVIVYNLDTNEQFRVNIKMQALDDVVISTYRNKKSARLLRDGKYTNILNAVDKDADWFELQKGSNIIAYAATKGVENLQFSIQTRVLYEGI